MNSLGYDSLVMSKRYRPHRHERRQQYAVKMRLETLKAESNFAPNRPRTKSVVTVESTHRSKLGAQHVRKQLRRSPTFHRGVKINGEPVDTTVGIKDNPTPFTQLSDTFTLTDSERATLQAMACPIKPEQLKTFPINPQWIRDMFTQATIRLKN